ncbi:ketopantoate reductase family protein [Oceanobacillus sp. Castelsardo]|uniref:ketopantoate reductase family protein n=1 Tax=Oceanobacillus sp. Castelsardo TaxID=1851204 RepID=UPI0008395230|nr:ketopantoate reductase family protein [Oceanobacillus sp. Castelsardo]
MNVLVFGAGAVGAYFGGRMLEANHSVSFFVREKRAKQLKEEGLKLISPEGDFVTKNLTLHTSEKEVKNTDLIILAVKGYHLEHVIPQLKIIMEQTGAFVLPLLNGFEHIDKLDQAVGKEKVLGGFAYIFATLNQQGHVVHGGNSSSIKFGSRHESQIEVCNQLNSMNQHVKTNLLLDENIIKEMWRKYLLITAFSGITSATQLPSGFTINSESTFNVLKNILLEMNLIAEKEGVIFAREEVDKIISLFKQYPNDTTSSMHQDLRKGLPIEVEHLQGGAVRYAQKHNVTIPVIETIYGILKPYENGKPN